MTDRVITVGGLSLTAVPEFVSAIVLIVIFGVVLGWLPVTAAAPPGPRSATQVEYLLLPSLALVDGALRLHRPDDARGHDRGARRRLHAYCDLKGLSHEQGDPNAHVLRNSLLPTIAVVATQTGYLIGGLLVIEKLFNYNGIGQRIYTAAQYKDFTMLESGVLIVGIGYLAGDAHRRHLLLAAQSAHPLQSRRVTWSRCRLSRRGSPRGRDAAPAPAVEDIRRRRVDRRLLGLLRDLRLTIAPHDPLEQSADILQSPSASHWFGTDSSAATSSRACSRARATSSRSRRSRRCSGSSAGRSSASSRRTSAASSTTSIGRIIDAVLALPVVIIAVDGARRAGRLEADA